MSRRILHILAYLDTTALVAAFALGSATLGYWLGIRRARVPSAASSSIRQRDHNAANEVSSSESDSDEEGASGDGELGNVKAGLLEDCKLVSLYFVLFCLLVPRDIRQVHGVVHSLLGYGIEISSLAGVDLVFIGTCCP